jgi:hypothetical protein
MNWYLLQVQGMPPQMFYADLAIPRMISAFLQAQSLASSIPGLSTMLPGLSTMFPGIPANAPVQFYEYGPTGWRPFSL